MPTFLSDAWIDHLASSAEQALVAPDLQLVIQQVVQQEDGSERAFAVRVSGGSVRIESGRCADADVTFTQDRATAAAIAQGALSAQAAFMAGRLRVGGDLRVVIDRARELAAVADVFERTRAATAW